MITGLEDFLVISEMLRILITARDSNEGYISKSVLIDSSCNVGPLALRRFYLLYEQKFDVWSEL